MTLLLAVLACKDNSEDSGLVNLGPELTHTVPEGSYLEGDSIEITVSASDEDGVGGVNLVYRTIDGAFSSAIELQGSDGGGTWTGTIPGEDVEYPGVSYYFKATDLNDVEGISYLPEDLDVGFQIPVAVLGEALPFTEDFELDEGQVRLESLGWANASLAFPGYHWNLNELTPYEGVTSVIHQRGHEDVPDMDDWLISPPLDFSGTDRVQVSWYERGGSVDGANHSLWASTGSRDPESDDWVLVAELEPPLEGEWGRSQVVELEGIDGPAVYLAWRYQGAFTDEWRMDAVEVKELTADLSLTGLSWDPNPVWPGDTATVTVEISNLLDASAAGATLTASLPEGGGSFTSDTVDLGDIGDDAVVTGELELTVDESWPENAYLPLALEVTDAAGDTWAFETQLVVGYPSVGRFSLSMVGDGLVSVDIGVGDPDAPQWQEALFADAVSAGPLELEWDLTERYASLPPGPGEGRWFAKVTTGGQAAVTSFEIDHGDITYQATSLPVVLPEETQVVWLPEPPDPTALSVNPTPSSPTPGGSVDILPVLRNAGAPTDGATTLTLTATDPDVTVTSAGPVTLTSGTWGTNATASPSVPLSFEISAAHLDSTPVDLVLVVEDGSESFQVPVQVEVPWPVLKITAVDIDDGDGGDDDGLLEPGETAEIEFEITNVGAISTFGFVHGGPVIQGSSTATAAFSTSSENWGSVSPGVSKDEKFVITVDGGSALGDTLDLRLELTDDDTSYSVPLQIVLGEPPWLSVSAIDDNIGDALGYGFDIVNAQYRCDGVTFELVIESAEPYPQSAFVEMFALPTAGGYDLFRVVYNGGSAKLQGYQFNTGQGFFTIDTPTVTHVDDTHLKLAWSVEAMDLNTDNLSVAFGAGWCGSDTGSFCDHFANGWGYYYTGYYSSRFFKVKW